MTEEKLGKEIIEIFKRNLNCETNEEVLEAITTTVYWTGMRWAKAALGGGKNEYLETARKIEMDYWRIQSDLKDLKK